MTLRVPSPLYLIFFVVISRLSTAFECCVLSSLSMQFSVTQSRARICVTSTPRPGSRRYWGLYWSISTPDLSVAHSPGPSCDYDPRIARRMRYDAIDARRRAPGLLLFRRHLGPDFDPYV